MQEFTRSNVKSMAEEMVEVLNKYGFKNVEFDHSGANFNASEATIKMSAKIVGTKTRKETDLERFASRDGVDIHKVGPKGERLIEYHVRKPKYPYIYVTARGARYKCSVITAQKMFS